MLTDAAIKALKPKDKLYKVADRDGMYVAVQPPRHKQQHEGQSCCRLAEATVREPSRASRSNCTGQTDKTE